MEIWKSKIMRIHILINHKLMKSHLKILKSQKIKHNKIIIKLSLINSLKMLLLLENLEKRAKSSLSKRKKLVLKLKQKLLSQRDV
jgi:hypothetical protein